VIDEYSQDLLKWSQLGWMKYLGDFRETLFILSLKSMARQGAKKFAKNKPRNDWLCPSWVFMTPITFQLE